MKLVKIFTKKGEILKYTIKEKEDLKIYKDLIKLKSKLNTVVFIPISNVEYVNITDLQDGSILSISKFTRTEASNEI